MVKYTDPITNKAISDMTSDEKSLSLMRLIEELSDFSKMKNLLDDALKREEQLKDELSKYYKCEGRLDHDFNYYRKCQFCGKEEDYDPYDD